MSIPIKKANILLPRTDEMTKWSVVACDQYTSEPKYWEDVTRFVGDKLSTLNLTLPEIYLNKQNVDEKIIEVNKKMNKMLNNNDFIELENSVLYIERTQADGRIRKGLIAMVDLEDYSFEKGSQSLIRATEGTVLERIPPRVRVRENAPLELPHIMLLIDDENKNIIDNINKNEYKIVYDFDLMQNGGHIKGYKLTDAKIEEIFKKMETLANKEQFNKRYNIENKEVLLFAVGDGNHSLATAKTCYENLKKRLPKEEYLNHPARYALVEIVNLHSEALQFEPIHRVMFKVNPDDVIKKLNEFYNISETEGQKIEYIYKGKRKTVYINNPKSNLAVGSLQMFIDNYIKHFGGEVDYIHGDDVVQRLSNEEGNIGFILPTMDKSELFKTVILDGALPRKTFSMGHSYDKRYYLEARKIIK